MNKSLILVLFFSLSFACQAKFLPLPASLKNKRIHHIDISNSTLNWWCSYHVLFNACKLEQQLKINHAYADKNAFIHKMQALGLHNKLIGWHMIRKLANILKLQQFSYLFYDQFNKTLLYTDAAGDRPFHEKRLQQVKSYLFKNRGKFAVSHFGLQINFPGEDHILLISLIQHPNGIRRIFIYDNLNHENLIKPGSQAEYVVKYLYTRFVDSFCP